MVKKKFNHDIQIKVKMIDFDIVSIEWTDLTTFETIIRTVKLHSEAKIKQDEIEQSKEGE